MPAEITEALPYLLPLALLGGLAGGSTGFGTYLVIGPALWNILSPTESMGVALSAGLPVWALLLPLRHEIPWQRSKSILLWSIPGLLLGLALHITLGESTLQVGASLIILLALLSRYALYRQIGSGTSGVMAGALSTSVGFNGPPVFLGLADLQERARRGGTILCLIALSVGASALLLLADREEFLAGYLGGFMLLPAVGVGVFLGHLLARQIGKPVEWIAVSVSLLGALLLLARGTMG